MSNNEALIAEFASSGRGDLAALVATMFREAAGDDRQGNSSVEERIAVGAAIRNRLIRKHRGATTYMAVCLAPWQFSCWNENDPNRGPCVELARKIASWTGGLGRLESETVYLAEGVIGDRLIDRVQGATHYFNPGVVQPPDWAWWDPKTRKRPRTPVAIVGRHHFYAGIA